MTIDIFCAVILIFMSYLGHKTGAISQLIRIAAIVAAFVFSPIIAPILREIWTAESEIGAPMPEAISVGIAAFLIYFAVTLSGSLAIRTMRTVSKTLSGFDKTLGFFLGILKGSLIAYLIASVFLIAQVPIEKRDPEDKLHLRDSHLVKFAQENNILLPWQFPAIRELHAMLSFAKFIEKEKLQTQYRDQKNIADFLRRDDIRAMLADPNLVEAAEANFYPQTLADPRVRKFLNDKENIKKLNAIDWRALNNEPTK